MSGTLATPLRTLLLCGLAMLCTLPLKARLKPAYNVLQQTLTCRIDDRQQDMETRLTVHENGAVTILSYSIGVKHLYTSSAAVIRYISVEEAQAFMKGVKQRALQAGTITEMKRARYLMDIDFAYSEQNERYWYDMSHDRNSPQVNALHQYIEDFIRRHLSTPRYLIERDYK